MQHAKAYLKPNPEADPKPSLTLVLTLIPILIYSQDANVALAPEAMRVFNEALKREAKEKKASKAAKEGVRQERLERRERQLMERHRAKREAEAAEEPEVVAKGNDVEE